MKSSFWRIQPTTDAVAKTIQKQLLRLHSFGQRFPNSGALRRIVSEFHKDISTCLSGCLRKENGHGGQSRSFWKILGSEKWLCMRNGRFFGVLGFGEGFLLLKIGPVYRFTFSRTIHRNGNLWTSYDVVQQARSKKSWFPILMRRNVECILNSGGNPISMFRRGSAYTLSSWSTNIGKEPFKPGSAPCFTGTVGSKYSKSQ